MRNATLTFYDNHLTFRHNAQALAPLRKCKTAHGNRQPILIIFIQNPCLVLDKDFGLVGINAYIR